MSAPLYDALERAVKAIKNHPELAPASTVAMTDDGLWVTPWVMGASVTALMTWHDAMREVKREAEVMQMGGTEWTKLTIQGLLDDTPVTATVTTTAVMPSPRINPSESDLRLVASQEAPFRSGDKKDE